MRTSSPYNPIPTFFPTFIPIVLTGCGLLGCGSSEAPGDTPDTSPAADAGDVGTSDAKDGAPDGLVNPKSCDPFTQNCVEATNSKCRLIFAPKTDEITTACVAPIGAKKLGEECERPTDQPGVDTCAKGLYCSGLQYPKGTPPKRKCVELCAATCSTPGNDCFGLGPGPTHGAGICTATCVPYKDTCSPGVKCSVYELVKGGEANFFCTPQGTTAAYAACTDQADCGKDVNCRIYGDGAICSPHCNNAHPCADLSASCLTYVSPALAGWGSCMPSDYKCLGAVTWPAPKNPKETVTFTTVNTGSVAVVGSVLVRACAADDPLCAKPLDEKKSGADGLVTLTVPTTGAGFTGYFEASATGYLTSLVVLNRPIAETKKDLAIPLTTQAEIEKAVVGPALVDITRGLFATTASDCKGNLAGGAVFGISTADGKSVIAHGLPSSAVAGLVADSFDPALAQSSAGGVLAFNIPTGKTTASLKVPGTKSFANIDVPIRAGTFTFVVFEPTP